MSASTDTARTRLALVLGRWMPFAMLGLMLTWLVVVPLVILLVGSFSVTGLPVDFFTRGFTLDNYIQTYSDPFFWRMAWTTTVFAVCSALGSLTLGIILAWLVERTDLPARGLVRVLIILPLATPPVLLAIGWIMLLSPRTGFFNQLLQSGLGLSAAPFNIYSLTGMIFVDMLALVPSTFLILSPAFRNMDPNLEEAAMTSGARFHTMIWRVVLPLLLPAILAAGGFLLIVGFLVFDIPGAIGMPVGIFVLSTRVVYLATDAPTGMAEYGLIASMAIFFLVVLLLIAFGYQRATRRAARFVTVTGKGFRIRPFALKRWRWVAFGFVALYFTLVTIAPMGILIWASLMPWFAQPSWDMLQHVTLANHLDFFNNRRAVRAAQNSITISVISATAVAVISIIISWVVVRSNAVGRRVLDALAFLPIAIPGVMIGVALIFVYLTFDLLPIYGTIWIIVIAYVTNYISFGTRASNGVMVQLHSDLEEAAMTSGARWGRLMRSIIIPLTLPALVAVWIWVLAICMRELTSALLLQGRGNTTVPVLLWGYWTGGQPNRAAAVGVWLVVAMLFVIGLWQFMAQRSRLSGVRE